MDIKTNIRIASYVIATFAVSWAVSTGKISVDKTNLTTEQTTTIIAGLTWLVGNYIWSHKETTKKDIVLEDKNAYILALENRILALENKCKENK